MQYWPTTRFLTIALSVTTLACIVQPTSAAITASGDVYPTDPGSASDGSSTTIGDELAGSLTIDAGSTLVSGRSDIGSSSGSEGTVTVTGAGSLWDIERWLTVGRSGSGELNITAGGAVNVAQETKVAETPNSTGVIRFDQGTLTTESLYADFNNLTGTGTLHTHGLIAYDIDLVFDAEHGPQQSIILNGQPGQNVTIELDQTDAGVLGAGYRGGGTPAIRDGIIVNSREGMLGYGPGSSG